MTDQFVDANKMVSITPPPELVQQWAQMTAKNDIVLGNWVYIATQAARWGSDQELEACCAWVRMHDHTYALNLRATRRPKPPSLKEQALMALEDGDLGPGASLTPVEVCIIRRALEALDD
jgi:hypothetical protein